MMVGKAQGPGVRGLGRFASLSIEALGSHGVSEYVHSRDLHNPLRTGVIFMSDSPNIWAEVLLLS